MRQSTRLALRKYNIKMAAVNTDISYGHKELLEIFFKANSLVVSIKASDTVESVRPLCILEYEDGSDTAYSITFMSSRHLGFQNMLCDYLLKCGVFPQHIPTGSFMVRKNSEQQEKEWQEHRKKIGLANLYP